jgi:hypothetical protein
MAQKRRQLLLLLLHKHCYAPLQPTAAAQGLRKQHASATN